MTSTCIPSSKARYSAVVRAETRGDDTLDGGVVCEVKEDDGTFDSAGTLKVLHEVVCFFLGDTHRSKDHGETFGRSRYFCLLGLR